jgi:hypothetical protein
MAIKRILFVFLLGAFLSSVARGQATYPAASCNLSAVQAAITAELITPADGDIITIPVDTYTWTGTTAVTGSFTTSVTIQGAGAVSATADGTGTTGSDVTIIIDNINHSSGPANSLSLSAIAWKSLRLTGIFFQMNGSSTVAANGIVGIGGTSTAVRVDHNHFFLNLFGAQGMRVGGAVLGVADHRLGKYWRFRAADVLAWIERQRVGGRAGA